MYSYIWKTSSTIHEREFRSTFKINGIVPLMWREHCMECAMPLCYKTCNLFYPRMDKRCLRFEKGIVPIIFDDNRVVGAEIGFRRWAKLQTKLPHKMVTSSIDKYGKRNKRFYVFGEVIRRWCDLFKKYRFCQIFASLAERHNTRMLEKSKGSNANFFLVSVKNKEDRVLSLQVEMLSDNQSIYKISFVLKPGWNEYTIPVVEINLPSLESKNNCLRVYLNSEETGVLQFRYLDFVRIEKDILLQPAKKVKCVAWDLDNTLWDGVLGDIGKENVKINESALRVIEQLDERGILQTIVSKNTHDIVWPFLEQLGIDKYFLYPAINWGRKSQNILSIAKELNINVDTFALIDDSIFERTEVKSELSQVRVFDVKEIPDILSKEEFNVIISTETKLRRLSYQTEAKRKTINASWSGDYNSFLKSCELKMRLFRPIKLVETERCLELINRSNQYNISGNRYSQKDFIELLQNKKNLCYGISVKDKYGDYGIVGFATVQIIEHTLYLKDFVMSCRVAQKKVEQTFIDKIIQDQKYEKMIVELKKTDRNRPLQEEFKKMRFLIDEDSETHLKMHIYLLDYNGYLDENIYDVTMDY